MGLKKVFLAFTVACFVHSTHERTMDGFMGGKRGLPLPEHDLRFITTERFTDGRLVLMGFWVRWCAPCRAFISKL